MNLIPPGQNNDSGCACGGSRPRLRGARGFTLVELVVVVAIVLVILGFVLPAASTLWEQRRVAQAENLIQGLLMTTRARAMQADGVETGFLAFVDDEGVQHLLPIEQVQPPTALSPAQQVAWQNVFVIRDERDQVLPVPMRVVPRYVVKDQNTNPQAKDFDLFSEIELANDDFSTLPTDANQTQRHRNFFTIVYSTDGQLLVNRDVLIQDVNSDPDQNDLGDRTGLPVGPGDPDDATTEEYYNRDDSQTDTLPIGTAIPFVVSDDPTNPTKDVASNFPSVDGLLVYDDSLSRALPASEKRDFLLRAAHPLYVSRCTGSLIRGPVGETP